VYYPWEKWEMLTNFSSETPQPDSPFQRYARLRNVNKETHFTQVEHKGIFRNHILVEHDRASLWTLQLRFPLERTNPSIIFSRSAHLLGRIGFFFDQKRYFMLFNTVYIAVCSYITCIVLGWATLLQAGRSRVPFQLKSLNCFNLSNPSSCTMFLRLTQPLTEMSTRNLPED
jgi:hypothetical protein